MKLNKLATGVIATAFAVTAMSIPAKADEDFNKLLAILAGGLVINEIVKDKDRSETNRADDKSIRHRHSDGRWHTHPNQRHYDAYHKSRRDDHGRKDRDDHYKRDKRKTGKRIGVLHPIQDRIKKLPLPKSCSRKVRTKNHGQISAYAERCLEKHGYRVDRSGKVTHKKWRGLSRRPNLI